MSQNWLAVLCLGCSLLVALFDKTELVTSGADASETMTKVEPYPFGEACEIELPHRSQLPKQILVKFKLESLTTFPERKSEQQKLLVESIEPFDKDIWNALHRGNFLELINTALENSDSKNFSENLTKALNSALLREGYITSKFKNVSATKTGGLADSQTLNFMLDPGSLVAIQPLGVQSFTSSYLAQEDKYTGKIERAVLAGEVQEKTVRLTQLSSDLSLEKYVCDRIRLGVSFPLNATDIEDQLFLLRDDVAFSSVEGILKAANPYGRCPSEPDREAQKSDSETQAKSDPKEAQADRKSCLEVRVVKRKPIIASASIDSNSPRSVGSIRAGVGLRYRNPLDLWGGEFGVSYSNSFTRGNQVIDLDYRLPLNRMNGALSLRSAFTRNKVTEDRFEAFDIRGTSQLYDVGYRQPLYRTPRREFGISTGLTVQQGESIFLGQPIPLELGAEEDGTTQTSIVRFGAEYLQRGPRTAFAAQLQTNIGTELFDATSNSGALPDGQFVSLLGQAQFLRRQERWLFGTDHLFIAQLSGQWTPNSLFRNQQFVLGGGNSVRGFQQNAVSGDSGFRLSLENEITVWDRRIAQLVRERQGFLPDEGGTRNQNSKPENNSMDHRTQTMQTASNSMTEGSINHGYKAENQSDSQPKTKGCNSPLHNTTVKVIPFVDVGMVVNQETKFRVAPESQWLAGAGVGLNISGKPLTNDICEEVWNLRVDYGFPLMGIHKRDDLVEDSGLYFAWRYKF